MLFSVLRCFVVSGKTAKVLWYMNPKAENGVFRVRESKLPVSRCVPHMMGERERNVIESARMITWVSVCKLEKCSAY